MIADRQEQTSAIDRLQSLPDIFKGSQLALRAGWDSKTTSQYLYLWRQRGLVKPFGGHSDVFANLLRQHQPDWPIALAMAMPTAVIIGIESLRRAGWTTQIPSRPDVAVLRGGPFYANDHFALHKRSPRWFDKRVSAITRPSADGLKRSPGELSPAWSLVDMIQDDGWGRCGLDPDDVDWDFIPESGFVELTRVATLQQVDDPFLLDLLAERGYSPRRQTQKQKSRPSL